MIEMLPNGLRVLRRVKATREDAFDAWVNPERLRAWFGPTGASVVAVEGELAVGSHYLLRVRDPDGRIADLVWSFQEIAPPERLVFGWSVGGGAPAVREPRTVVVITFREEGPFTEIALEHTGDATQTEREMFVAGWEGCFDGLDTLLH